MLASFGNIKNVRLIPMPGRHVMQIDLNEARLTWLIVTLGGKPKDLSSSCVSWMFACSMDLSMNSSSELKGIACHQMSPRCTASTNACAKPLITTSAVATCMLIDLTSASSEDVWYLLCIIIGAINA